MSEHQQRPSTNAGIQGAIIFCFKHDVFTLAEDLAGLLEQQAEDPTRVCILSHGIMEKQQDGFIVMECRGGFPAEFIDWLRVDGDVQEFAVYDRPEEEGL